MSYTCLCIREIKKCRKAHTCIWCGERINAASGTVYQTSVYYNEFQASYYHHECYNAGNDYDWEQADNEFEPGSFKRGTCEERR